MLFGTGTLSIGYLNGTDGVQSVDTGLVIHNVDTRYTFITLFNAVCKQQIDKFFKIMLDLNAKYFWFITVYIQSLKRFYMTIN